MVRKRDKREDVKPLGVKYHEEYEEELQRIQGQLTNNSYITVIGILLGIWGLVYGLEALGGNIGIGVIVAGFTIGLVGIIDIKMKTKSTKNNHKYITKGAVWTYNRESAVMLNSATVLDELIKRYSEILEGIDDKEIREITKYVNWEVAMVNPERGVVENLGAEVLLTLESYKEIINKTPVKYTKELEELNEKMYTILVDELKGTEVVGWMDDALNEDYLDDLVVRLRELDQEWYELGKKIKVNQKEVIVNKLKTYIEEGYIYKKGDEK